MHANIIDSDSYWNLRKPFDRYLPDSIPAGEVELELATIQDRFRQAMSPFGTEGEDWEFPSEPQHVRVFYAYIYAPFLYAPSLAKAVADALSGFDQWIGELECYSIPGMDAEALLLPFFLRGEFYLDADDSPSPFAEALRLDVRD